MLQTAWLSHLSDVICHSHSLRSNRPPVTSSVFHPHFLSVLYYFSHLLVFKKLSVTLLLRFYSLAAHFSVAFLAQSYNALPPHL